MRILSTKTAVCRDISIVSAPYDRRAPLLVMYAKALIVGRCCLNARSTTSRIGTPKQSKMELALLTLMALSLVVCLYLLRTRDVAATVGAERR